jgi:signal transduction histidine kinase
LTRLAQLIARGASPTELFTAVTMEIRQRYTATTARLIRYESDGSATVLANDGTVGTHVRVGGRWANYPECGLTQQIWRTGRPARVNDYRSLRGGEFYVTEGLIGAVGVPIRVHGALWGLIAIGSATGALPPDAEERLAEFTELTATAVATAQGRAEIAASRARIVAASDEVRRRIERDLHDGVQQRLMTLAMRLTAMAECTAASSRMRADLQDASNHLMTVMEEVREIARGIYPAILAQAGLGPALRTLARRSSAPARVRANLGSRLPREVEVAAYYVVSEALTNAVKYSRAQLIDITAEVRGPVLKVTVTDDGIGGADPTRGSGLIGLTDRVEALGGRLWLHSPHGDGTRIDCEIPVSCS